MNPRVRQRVDEDGSDMNRKVRQRVDEDGKDNVGAASYLLTGDEDAAPKVQESSKDWSSLTYDLMLHVFTLLDNRDRASLASTCTTLRSLGASPHLWSSLDLRAHRFDDSAAASLADRCADLEKVRFDDLDSAAALVNLKAKKLREITGESCENLTDATLAMIIARHEALESLDLGRGFGERITSQAIKIIAICCPKLKKLRISRMVDVSAEAILSLAEHCPLLSDVGFLDCLNINEEALGKVVSLRFLSVTRTINMNWRAAEESWGKLPNLTGLDVSRTGVNHATVSRLLTTSKSLKVVCALNCPVLEHDADFNPGRFEGKLLIAKFNNTLHGIAPLFFEDNSSSEMMPEDDTRRWLEGNLSRTLLSLTESNLLGLNGFWQKDGAKLFLRLMQSSQEEVQERATRGLASFIHLSDDSDSIYRERADSVVRDGGIPILFKLTESWKESFQAEAAKAIANLSLNADAAKAVAEAGGVSVLLGLAKSRNRLVAQEAAGAIWNLSLGDAYKAISRDGGVNVLMDLLSRWSYDYGELMERAAGALANLAGDENCSIDIAKAGGANALVMLARNCEYAGAREHAARGLANLAAHDDSNNNNAAIGEVPRALETIIQLTRSRHGGVRQEAAGALWNLAYDENNRKLIAELGGVEASVALANYCMDNTSSDLQKSAAGALWNLSNSEEHSIVIGREGGIPPLVALARSEYEDVHEVAAGALWNLSFTHVNALLIVEEEGVLALGRMCTSSPSKMARFLAALTLAYIFDGRLDGSVRASPKHLANVRRSGLKYIESYIDTFMDPQTLATAASSYTSSMLAKVLKRVRIPEADILKCSGKEIERFVTMLRNPSPVLKKLAAFALLQFTVPEASHAKHHVSLMHDAGDPKHLRIGAAATNMPHEAKIFAKIVLRNLEHHQPECSKGKTASTSK